MKIWSEVFLVAVIYKMHQENTTSNQSVIGNITFKTKIPPKLSRSLLKMTEQDQWILDIGKYQTQHCKEIFLNTKEARIKKIWLGYNQIPEIPFHIQNISFPNLTELWISQNQIENICIIQHFNMPMLEELWIRDNIISSIGSLRKLNFPNFRVLSLYANKIQEFKVLSELFSPKLKELWVEYQLQEDIQGENLCYCFKLEAKNLTDLWISSEKRTLTPKKSSMLKKKYPGLNIITSAD